MTNTPNQGVELLACPFCGATDEQLVQAFTRTTETFAYWSVECLNCACEIASDGSRAEADTAWNTRATPTPASSGVLVEALERIAAGKFTMNEARGIARQALSTTATPASDDAAAFWDAVKRYSHPAGTEVVVRIHETGWDVYDPAKWSAPRIAPTPDRFGEGYRAGVEAATIAAQLTKAQREAIGTVLPSRSVKGSAVTLQALWDKGLIKGGYNLQFGADPTPIGLAVRAIILEQSA